MDLFILKTDGKKFTSTNEKKTLHMIFKGDLGPFFLDPKSVMFDSRLFVFAC